MQCSHPTEANEINIAIDIERSLHNDHTEYTLAICCVLCGEPIDYNLPPIDDREDDND